MASKPSSRGRGRATPPSQLKGGPQPRVPPKLIAQAIGTPTLVPMNQIKLETVPRPLSYANAATKGKPAPMNNQGKLQSVPGLSGNAQKPVSYANVATNPKPLSYANAATSSTDASNQSKLQSGIAQKPISYTNASTNPTVANNQSKLPTASVSIGGPKKPVFTNAATKLTVATNQSKLQTASGSNRSIQKPASYANATTNPNAFINQEKLHSASNATTKVNLPMNQGKLQSGPTSNENVHKPISATAATTPTVALNQEKLQTVPNSNGSAEKPVSHLNAATKPTVPISQEKLETETIPNGSLQKPASSENATTNPTAPINQEKLQTVISTKGNVQIMTFANSETKTTIGINQEMSKTVTTSNGGVQMPVTCENIATKITPAPLNSNESGQQPHENADTKSIPVDQVTLKTTPDSKEKPQDAVTFHTNDGATPAPIQSKVENSTETPQELASNENKDTKPSLISINQEKLEKELSSNGYQQDTALQIKDMVGSIDHKAIIEEEIVKELRGDDDTNEPVDKDGKVDPNLAPPIENTRSFNLCALNIGSMEPRSATGKYCEAGQTINVFSNNFKIAIDAECVYQYYIEIFRVKAVQEEEKYTEIKLKSLNWKRNREVMEKARVDCALFKDSYFVFDGDRKLITDKPLDFKKKTTLDFELKITEKKSVKYSILLMEADKGKGLCIDLTEIKKFYSGEVEQIPEEVIAAIEIILRHGPSISFIPVRRSFYQNDNVMKISGGLELWSGHHQSIAIGEKTLLINVDKAITTFYPSMPLLRLIAIILNKRNVESLSENDIRYLNIHIKDIKVTVKTLPNMSYLSLKSIINTCAKKEFYQTDQFKGTLYDYYLKKHKIKLRYPFLPLGKVGNNNMTVSLEVLTVKSEQPFTKKLLPVQNTEMIRYSAIIPKERFNFIVDKMHKLDEIWAPVKKYYQIKISLQPFLVPAQKLNAPTLLALQEKKILPVDGSWSMKGSNFVSAVELKSWIIINCTRMPVNNLMTMVGKLKFHGTYLGFIIKDPISYLDMKEPSRNLDGQLCHLVKEFKNLQIIFFVIDDVVDQPFIKTFCKDVLKVPSQCIKQQNISRILNKPSSDILLNLCLSLNSKIGGTNVCLLKSIRPPILNSLTMVMGADVNHASPGSDKPSIASVVGSIDFNICRYTVLHAQQEGRVEIIDKIGIFTKTLLTSFQQRFKRFPVKLIFFRDGVGKGQYKTVKEKELALIQNACKDLDCDLKITFIIVTKRHNTRFCPKDPKDGVGRPQNIPPGTTVDRLLCHPTAYEFFQCDHIGIQGTSKPTKYSVILDQNQISATELQILAYYLCHTYAYCTKSISIPTPVQYAHNDAYHGKDFTLSEVGKTSKDEDSQNQYKI